MYQNLINKFNDYIAEKLSIILSMMTTFYIVTLLVIIPLFYSAPTSIVAWASYLCSVVFQGIALPVLGYTARKSSNKSDKLMEEIYKLTDEIYRLTNEIDGLVKMIKNQEAEINEEVKEILDIEKHNNNK